MAAAAAALGLQSPSHGGHKRLSGSLRPQNTRTARSVLTGNSFSTSVGKDTSIRQPLVVTTDFASDVGRKKFGFSHEELDDATAYYEGQFKVHMRWGHGTMHSPETGSKYVGQFQNDQFHGEGGQVWPDGSKYSGQWRNGQKHGHGAYTSAEQLTYVGQWENSRRHGQGAQDYANSDRYEGWWFRGMCSGLGTYHFADGSRYEGAWANGRYEGAGVLSGNDGSRERHWYSNGLLVKREVLPPSRSPKAMGSRKNFLGGNVIHEQTREEMQKPTVLSKLDMSKYLIRRETDGLDLSAPPLKALASPAGRTQGKATLEDLSVPPLKPLASPAGRTQGKAALEDSLDLEEAARMQATWPQTARSSPS